MRGVFARLKDGMKRDSAPSEWCQPLLRTGCGDPGHKPELSAEEWLHIKSPITDDKIESFAPSAREIVHRAHEMRAALVRDAAWDPKGLLGLPFETIERLSLAFERRGCRGLGIAEALCLPFLLYSTDTVHVLRLSKAMRGLSSLRGSCTVEAAEAWLGNYAGVVCALVEAGGLLRRYVNPSHLLPVLSLQTKEFLDSHHLVFRGLWLPREFDLSSLCRCYNLTSWSLWVQGALSVLEVYRGRVGTKANIPVLLIALRKKIMHLALPTTALYFAASPDGKVAGRQDRPNERLPRSTLRPERNDSGVAQGEKEIVLPPFCHLTPFEGGANVKLAKLSGEDVLQHAISEWKLHSKDTDWLRRELDDVWYDIVKGRRSLRRRDVGRCLCVFIRDVTGSWFDGMDNDKQRT